MDDAKSIKSLKELDKRLRKMYDRGEEAADKQNFPYAITMFRELLKKEPGVLEVRQRLRLLQLQQLGKPTFFHQFIANLIAIPFWMINGNLLKTDSLEKAIKAMDNAEQMLTIDCTAVLPLCMLDRAAYEAELPEVSVQALEWAIQFHPKSVFLWARLGAAYSNAGMGKKSLEVYRKLVSLQPNSTKWQDAVKDATAEAAMDEGGWNRVERGEGDYQSLIRDKETMARLEHSGHTIRTAEGLETLIQGAREDIAGNDNADNRRRLADLLTEAKRYDEAIAAYESVQVKLGLVDPAIEQAILNVRIAQFDNQIAGQQTRADSEELTDAERAEALEQVEVLRKAKVDALLNSMRDRVKRYPNQVEDRMQLAKMLIDDGKVDEAITHFQRLQAHPNLAVTASYYLGRCFFEKRVYDLSVEQFQRVIDGVHNMTTLKKDAYYDLAKTYEAMGDQEQAISNYKAIYSVDTNYRDVGEIIGNLYKE